jgi:hypothetical protein
VLQFSENKAIDNKSIKDISKAPISTKKYEALSVIGDRKAKVVQLYKIWAHGRFEFLIPFAILW